MTAGSVIVAGPTHNALSDGRVVSSRLQVAQPVPSHKVTYIAIFLFTFVLYFRPYELHPALASFNSLAYWCGLFAVVSYLVTQFINGRGPTVLTTETKCVMFIAASALLLMPLSRDISRSWEVFNDPFIRVVVIFLVMANILVTERRIRGLMWLGVGIGLYLSYQCFVLNEQGVFNTQGFRVSVQFGGMFGNPNDMSVHFVMFIPIAITLGLSTSNAFLRMFSFGAAALMLYGITLTQSRGGFLALLAVTAFLIHKLGRKYRLRIALVLFLATPAIVAVSPRTYSERLLSIFSPSLDQTGSSTERQELLTRSIAVTIRNPLGVGLGNSSMFGIRGRETHNAYTQVSSELGWLALIAYFTFLFVPFRQLWRIEKDLPQMKVNDPFRYQLIGTRAAILGFAVCGLFASVAYQWYVFYPIAFAIGLRFIHKAFLRSPELSIAA